LVVRRILWAKWAATTKGGERDVPGPVLGRIGEDPGGSGGTLLKKEGKETPFGGLSTITPKKKRVPPFRKKDVQECKFFDTSRKGKEALAHASKKRTREKIWPIKQGKPIRP